jgi:hypothetical protein
MDDVCRDYGVVAVGQRIFEKISLNYSDPRPLRLTGKA